MRRSASPAGLFALTTLVALAFAVPAAALADTGDVIEKQNEPPTAKDGWQAGTCTDDTAPKCSPDTPGLFFKQAAGHPQIGFTQYIVKHKTELEGVLEEPVRVPKTIRADLPEGLTVNPQATPQCELAVFELDESECPPGSIIGREEVTTSVVIGGVIEFPPGSGEFLPKNAVLPPNPLLNTIVPIYNLVPELGEPARFGFKIGIGKEEVYLEADVAWESDYHQGFTIRLPEPNPLVHTLKSRLVNEGRKGDGTFITNPPTCFDPEAPPFLQTYSTFLRADSYEEPDPDFPVGLTRFEAPLPEGVQQEGCEEVPFDPSLDVTPGTQQVDSPAAPTVTTELPFIEGGETISESHLRNAEITLPPGMGLNPSAANGLQACTDAQFGKGTRNEIACPPASQIGTAEVETPPLPPGSLEGAIYLGQQLSFDPTSGQMYRIFVSAESDRYGISARLIGNVSANPTTGQLTARFNENPQVPFESVKLKFDPAKGVLTSPPTCGPNETKSVFEPWSTSIPTEPVEPTSFELPLLPGGGSCPQTLAQRPFDPGYGAGPQAPGAGAFSPFEARLTRPDGAQEFRRVDVMLPPGMVAKLRGLEYCPEGTIAAAAQRTGAAEIGKPSCPDSSFVGVTETAAGTGAQPLKVKGNVYLAGPYKGAPVSLVFVTPAVAGPFDLGTIVVRVALYIDPETAEVNAVSDTIPDVFGGAKLDIRSIDVSLNRPRFTVNPTTCRRPFFIRSDIFGGGGNPADAASWFRSHRGSRFQAIDCRSLRFKPKFYARIFGGKGQTRRTANPKFRAIVDARKGDANVHRAAFILPRATILDQSHIRTICTRVQLAADNCPKRAIYGHARATSPLLDGVLKGPVYLTSSDRELPDLLADLRGQVDIRLRGALTAVRGRLKTVFFPTPDVAVNKFILLMRGGSRGLLINSQNLCERTRFGYLNLRAQNSRTMKTNRLRLNVPACRRG